MASQTPKFSTGSVVQRLNQPEAVGVVRTARWNSQTDEWEYSVQFGAQVRAVPEATITTFQELPTPWAALHASRFGGREQFIFALTFHRLRHPPARIAHSFATTRTIFYPHQFKPLLKFLDNPSKRLLIADDVGLGKTIEAGYILRELEAHEEIERVLIVVPARLQPKWKRELQQRFNEVFEIVKGQDLLRQAERIRRGREPEGFRWIISYESLRPEDIRSAIEETELPIDVLIFDEAHRMRNPETLQHKVGSALCRASGDSVIFLSATPVQNKLEDLWHILRLLSPDEFKEWPVFQQQMDANRGVISIQNALSSSPPNLSQAIQRLDSFLRTQPGQIAASTAIARSIRERLAASGHTRADLVELQSDIGRLSPTGQIICRTRKVEAITNRAVREANWCRVQLSPAEREVYDSVQEVCRRAWLGHPNSWGFQMSLLMAYRITASCIPAAIRYFAERLRARNDERDFVQEVEEQEGQSFDDVSAWTQPVKDSFAELVDLYRTSSQSDSKFSTFLDALVLIWDEDQRKNRKSRKIVVFSFFRRTLEYLSKMLTEQAISNRMIHGGVAIDDREIAIEEFLETADVRVLLTSEVGGEGLDLQKASVVINYDLPWNPMIVEQRVGRVDRIGQQSDRIIILNLVVQDSIEERVVQRLLHKIGIFRNSIGELDEIIGEEIERLSEKALRGELSDAELERAIEERGKAIVQRLHEAREVLSKVDKLLAADQGLIDEINSIIGERQIPGENELLLFLNKFLASRVPGCQFPEEVSRRVLDLDLRPLINLAHSDLLTLGVDGSSFARRAATGTIPITLSREAAYAHPKAELIHLQHPLIKYAVSEVDRSGDQRHNCFALRLVNRSIGAGLYAFMVAALHIRGHRSRTKLITIAYSVDRSEVMTDQEVTTPLVIRMIEEAQDVEAPRMDEAILQRCEDQLLLGLGSLKSEWYKRETSLDQARREQQKASKQATLEFLVNRALDRLKTLSEKRAGDFAVRMSKGRLDKANRELEALKAERVFGHAVEIEHEEIAVGLLQIVANLRK